MTDIAAIIVEADRLVIDAFGEAPSDIVRVTGLRDSDTLAGRIDHTLLKADATQSAVEQLCAEAVEYGFASVCVNPHWVPLAAETLQGAAPMVCTVVGFPLGATSHRAKAAETAIAVEEGADEIDMVMDIGAMLSGDLAGVYEDMAGVVAAAGDVPVKVILETCLLDDVQKAAACLIAVRAGLAYVKTSTGFSTGGATAADIALMRAVVGDELGVKASGAIRSTEDAETMLAAGADRVGASASIAIVSGDSSGAAQGY